MKLSKIPLESLPTDLIQDFVRSAKLELSARKRKEKRNKRRDFILNFSYKDAETPSEAIQLVKKHNSKNNLSLRNIHHEIPSREKYFNSLIDQDWSKEYPTTNEPDEYYVYCHVDPNKRIFVQPDKYGGNYGGQPFYIGKGIGIRAFDFKRNQGHGKMIKSLLSDGWTQDDIVHIPFSGLTELKAYELESKLIYFFGTIYEKERSHGVLYNLNLPLKPDFLGIMEKIPTRKSFESKKSGI